MRYLLLSVPFLLAAGLGGWMLRRRHPVPRMAAALGVTLAVMVTLTAVFDSLMIGAGLFDYPDEHLLGVRVGLAPLEDFGYPLAAVALLPALWLALTRGVRMGRLLRAAVPVSRPISWINTAYPFAAALLLSSGELSPVLVLGTLYYLVPYNLAMYGINDVYDYASDVANPRKGGIEGALLAPDLHRPMIWLVAATNLPFLIVLCAAGGPATWLALAVSTFAVVAYSARGMRFKERPVLDSLTSATHFVSPAVVGLTLGGATVTPSLVLLLVAFTAWGMAAHAFGAVQDIGPDREGGIASIATVFGARMTVRLSIVLWLVAGVAMLVTTWPGPLAALVAVPYVLNALPYLRLRDDEAYRANTAWRRFIVLNFFAGFVVTLVLILFWTQTH